MNDSRVRVYLGGTNVRAALLDSMGSIIRELEAPTEASRGADYVIGKMTRMINDVIGDHEVKGVGVGSPGPVNPHEGVILSPPNLPNWDHVPLVLILQKELQLPVFLENDANAVALGEAKIGAGVGCQTAFYITIANLVHKVNPEIFIFGGGVMKSRE